MRALDCDIPIIPGIMPILNFAQVARMAELSGAELPREVLDQIEPIADDKDAVRAKGIELATQLCRDLLAGGAPGPALHHPEPVEGDAGDLRGAARRRPRLAR